MSERIVPADESTARTPNDTALQTAWMRFHDFDRASIRQKQSQQRIRIPIIVLMFLATVLAVVITYANSVGIVRDLRGILRVLLIVIPLFAAGLLAYAYQFSPSLAWITYRLGAEEIRQHIYLYRMQAGKYASRNLEEQQRLLLDNVQDASTSVHEVGAPVPFLQFTFTTEPVPAKTNSPEDDGYSALTADDYVRLRVIPQSEWYLRKLNENYTKLRIWRIAILVVTGLSSAIAALGGEPWVAVTTALSLAFAQFIDLKMYGHTYANYHHTAGRLIDEVSEWRILPPEKRQDPAYYSPFVERIERIFEDERNNWMRQAVQAQTANEQAIMKQLGREPLRFAALTFNTLPQSADHGTTVAAEVDDTPGAEPSPTTHRRKAAISVRWRVGSGE